VAVTAWGNLINNADMEVGTPIYHRFGIFHHTAVDIIAVGICAVVNGTKVADANTASTSYALVVVNMGFVTMLP
jgi:hypothetical protein